MSAQGSKPHELRTATEPRQNSFYKLRVSHIYQVNPTIRLIRFNIFCGCTSLDWSKDNSENVCGPTTKLTEIPALRVSVNVSHLQ